MKKKIKKKSITGYIEGYYGKLLSWEDRELIVKSLYQNNMNTYFYAPKEDINHRLLWKKKYKNKWRLNFRKFTNICKKNKINIIAGIAPGLDFNFKQLNEKNNINKKSDFEFLLSKAYQLLDDGATSIALLLDDIPADFKNKFGNKISEGTYHGILANKLLQKLGQNIYFVPRIYADELIEDDPFYLEDLSSILNPNIIVFYCGKNVVSKSLTNYNRNKKHFQNRIIFWDNYYANDYCPRRLFVGPFLGRQNVNDIMINPTGLINTDLLILDIFANNFNDHTCKKEWEKILGIHGVPKTFLKVKKYFLKPDFDTNPISKTLNVKIIDLKSLDFLLWKWKGKLSREWYPFIFGLKHDLQIHKKLLTSKRKIKTQTAPLSEFLLKGEI
tara:strand:- start:1345 stop:2502 length:1158 start_codon:yes stop_codon:yes gene_type:complete